MSEGMYHQASHKRTATALQAGVPNRRCPLTQERNAAQLFKAVTNPVTTRGTMRGFDDHTDLSVLLADTAAKDRTAFAVLYRRTSARLFGIVSRIIQSAPDAEEVLQEVYLGVWRSAQFFNASRGKPMTWLISIARNAAVDEARRRGSRGHGSISQFDPELHGAAAARDGADHADLIACMHALDERRREMVHLAYVHGYSREELADRFNSNSSSIKSVLRRTLLFLRSCLLLDPSEPETQPV